MKQRGRKSADNIVSFPIDGSPLRLDAPDYLTKPERVLFEQIIAACAPTHFGPADLPLLASFVQWTLTAQKTVRDASRFDQWERATRMQMALAVKLRLAPQARTDAKAIVRHHPATMRTPWEKE